MIHEASTSTPERDTQILVDNARKFIVEPLDPEFLKDIQSVGFSLTVDWIETSEDEETKLVYKLFDTGELQILLISKVMKDGSRTFEKEKVTKEKYDELLHASILHLAKMRYEFKYTQHGIDFDIKYDEFEDSELRILEVDASNEEERELFNPDEFPVMLREVTGDMRYYGYRVSEVT